MHRCDSNVSDTSLRGCCLGCVHPYHSHTDDLQVTITITAENRGTRHFSTRWHVSFRYLHRLRLTDLPSTVLSSSAKVMVFNFIGGGMYHALPSSDNQANILQEIEERYDDITCKIQPSHIQKLLLNSPRLPQPSRILAANRSLPPNHSRLPTPPPPLRRRLEIHLPFTPESE